MAIDLLGGVFSDLSLVFKPKFDVIAGVAYSLVVVRVVNSNPVNLMLIVALLRFLTV